MHMRNIPNYFDVFQFLLVGVGSQESQFAVTSSDQDRQTHLDRPLCTLTILLPWKAVDNQTTTKLCRLREAVDEDLSCVADRQPLGKVSIDISLKCLTIILFAAQAQEDIALTRGVSETRVIFAEDQSDRAAVVIHDKVNSISKFCNIKIFHFISLSKIISLKPITDYNFNFLAW
jgi:hypothetical protein